MSCGILPDGIKGNTKLTVCGTIRVLNLHAPTKVKPLRSPGKAGGITEGIYPDGSSPVRIPLYGNYGG
jgi:hypothetical protein